MSYDPSQPRVPDNDMSGQGGQWTKTAVSSAPPSSINEFRNNNFNAPKEIAVLVKDGVPVKTVGQNKKHNIEFSEEEMKLIQNGEIIHNHPSASALSEDDFLIAQKVNLSKIEAFGTDAYTGEKVSWTASRPLNGWPNSNQIRSAYKMYESVYVIRARDQMKMNGWNSYQAAHWATNEILKRVAEKTGIEMVKNVYP